MSGNASANNLSGGAENDVLTGRGGADTLRGDHGNDTLDGGLLADLLEGGVGDDRYYVNTDADRVREAAGQGFDTVRTTASFTLHRTLAEVEVLRTTDVLGLSAINLTGSDFKNELIGNFGPNILNGRGDADTMRGYRGNDTYIVDNAGDRVVS